MRGIYLLRFPGSNRIYVGSALSVPRRQQAHLAALRRGNHPNVILQRTYAKYGTPELEVLEQVPNAADLITREQAWIDALAPNANLAPTAGSCLGLRWTEEQRRAQSERSKGRVISDEARAKASESLKGREFSVSHRRNLSDAGRGRTLAEATRSKIRERALGRKVSPETRAKISRALRGRKMSEENKAAAAERMRGHKYNLGRKASPETRAKMREAAKGRVISAEARAKTSAALKGRKLAPFSEERRKNMSEVAKLRWAKARGEA